jgi:hypothetical protein
MKKRGFRYCSACNTKLQKWSKTKAGTPRWRCPKCKSTSTKNRPDLQKALQLEQFVNWLLGKQTQAEMAGSSNAARTWRSKIAWCWDIIPKPALTGEIYPVILIDGLRVGSLVSLIARTPRFVINWHWSGWESSNTWAELLEQHPPPLIVVCDGQKGILGAISRCWPKTRVQRCHFHVWQNVRTKLTLHPKTKAGQQLLDLTRILLKGIGSIEESKIWEKRLHAWGKQYNHLIKERTYAENPRPGKHNWWYTHGRLRSAYRQLEKLVSDNQLFTYLDEELIKRVGSIPRTTNHVEGGINSQLRTKLKLHRGMSQQHQQRLVEWYLYSRTDSPKPTRKFL